MSEIFRSGLVLISCLAISSSVYQINSGSGSVNEVKLSYSTIGLGVFAIIAATDRGRK